MIPGFRKRESTRSVWPGNTRGPWARSEIGVSMHLATPAGGLPLDWELDLPEEWAEDPERCRKAGIPGEVTKRAKWQLALDLTDRVLSWKLQLQIVVSDAAYGSVAEYRDGLIESIPPMVITGGNPRG